MWIESFCEFPFNRARITCEGNVSMCCFQRPDPLKPESDAYLGNVLEQTFDEIWFSDLCEDIRWETREGRLHKKCQCPGCPILPLKQPYPVDHVVYNEYPNFLEIDLPNTHCNVGGKSPSETSPACIMCERAAPFFRPEEDHLMEVLSRIKHIVPNLYQIHIQGIAEPFFPTKGSYLLFDVMDALDYEEYKNQITISVTTNGTIFKKSIREEYLKRAPHSITNFSIDAATPETFKAIRIFDCFEKVLANMYAFDEERVREEQYLRVHNNINIMNVHEAVAMVEIAHKARAEYVEFNPTNGFNHKILVDEKTCGLFRKAQEDIIAECERLGQPYKMLRPLDLGLTEQLVQLTL
jgi:MoaA/NifB/PqqE/SkfB family radical SAM enzyme